MFFVALVLFSKNLFEPWCLPLSQALVGELGIMTNEELFPPCLTPERSHLLPIRHFFLLTLTFFVATAFISQVLRALRILVRRTVETLVTATPNLPVSTSALARATSTRRPRPALHLFVSSKRVCSMRNGLEKCPKSYADISGQETCNVR
jgi:hypothetical protein